MRKRLLKVSGNFHEFVHLALGLLVAWFMYSYYPDTSSFLLIICAVLGVFVPDIDHLLFWFIYGRSSDYSKEIKSLLKNFQFRKVATFCRNNHKHNYKIYSHNVLSFTVVILLAVISFKLYEDIAMTTLFLAWTTHYLYDMLEDILFFGKLNPNWYFKFKLPDSLILSPNKEKEM